MAFDFSDDARKAVYVQEIERTGRSRGNNMAAFFRATFEAWKDYRRSGREQVYVGYSPIIGVDAAAILGDLPGAHVLHVVRNPWSAYADTKKRPLPLPLAQYMLGWTSTSTRPALPRAVSGALHIVRTEDVMADSARGSDRYATPRIGGPLLVEPSWNAPRSREFIPGERSARRPRPRTSRALSLVRRTRCHRQRAWQYLDVFDYRGFV
jgi:hypothetical protein